MEYYAATVRHKKEPEVTYHMVPFIYWNDKILEMENRSVLARVWGEEAQDGGRCS